MISIKLSMVIRFDLVFECKRSEKYVTSLRKGRNFSLGFQIFYTFETARSSRQLAEDPRKTAGRFRQLAEAHSKPREGSAS